VYHDLLKIAEPYHAVFYEDEALYAADSAQTIDFVKRNKTKKKGVEYVPFPGICLTDTFQLGETGEGENLFSEIFPQNSERVLEQKKTPLRVIMGNPPYSVGQKSANDNAQNQSYPKLEARIAETYAASSTATNKKYIYDSYIKAFRWSTDRIDPNNGGIIGFITNSGWLDKGGIDGMRKYIAKEFSSIYVFDLKGAIKGKRGEATKREGQNVFDILTGVAITILVKNPTNFSGSANIFYKSIGDYINRKEKFNILHQTKSIVSNGLIMERITPNINADWVNQRSSIFDVLIPIAPENKYDLNSKSFFLMYGIGVASNRDTWVYNFSNVILVSNIRKMITFYNEQRIAYLKEKNKIPVEAFIDHDLSKISWSRALRNDLKNNIIHKQEPDANQIAIYRPFIKQNLYYDKSFIESPGIFSTILPPNLQNLIICLPTIGNRNDFFVLLTNAITDLHVSSDGTQCFPLYWYEKKQHAQGSLFEKAEDKYIRHDAVSDFILDQAHTRYGLKVTKEDIFYYVYGLLHSPSYRETFANDLKKMLPRLPLVEKPADFWAFSKAGRQLADLHLNYEDQKKPPEVTVTGLEHKNFTVTKISFPAKGKTGTINYNAYVTISNIPEKAYQYIVNGKSAIEWIMERYAVTTHKESGIKNDPNDWAIEHGNPRYILDLLLSVITVSVKTVDIVEGLPKVEWK
jgi:predicted helicase